MASAVISHAAGNVTERWLVTCASAEEMVVPLRDYFRRLGLQAWQSGGVDVEVDLGGTDVDESDLQEFVESWTKANGVSLGLRPAKKPPAPWAPPRIGELLISKGLLTSAQLELALAKARTSGDLTGVVLVRERFVFEEDLARTLAQQLSIPYVSLGRVGFDRSAVSLLPRDVGLRAAAIPVRFIGGAVQVAFADPTDPDAVDAVCRHLPAINLAVGELSDIMQGWHLVSSGSV